MGDMVEVKPGMWLRAGVSLTITDPVTSALVTCPRCAGDAWTVQADARVKCDKCGLTGRAT